MTSSMLAVCSTVPYLTVSLAGGSVVDRRSKKAIMLVCDFIADSCDGAAFVRRLSLVLTVDLSTFLFAFLTLLFFIKIPEVKTENNSKLFEIIPDIKTGLSYMKGPKGILYLLIIYSSLNFLGAISFDSMMSPLVLFGCFGMPFYFAYESAILRERVPVEVQGKLFALRGMIENALTPIGYFLGAILADYIFEPFMKGSSKLRQLLTHVVGEGSGAGISLIFILAGLIGFVLTLILRNNKYIKELN